MASTINIVEDDSTPSTPTESRSLDVSASETLPLPTSLDSIPEREKGEQDKQQQAQAQEQQQHQHQRPQLRPRTTSNRKLAIVRRQKYCGSTLRTEMHFDDDHPKFPRTLDTGNFSTWGRSPPPTSWPTAGKSSRHRAPESTIGPCAKDAWCEDYDCDHTPPTPPPQRPYFPCLAIQACVRMPRPPTPQELEAEQKDRFPSSSGLRLHGNPCSSPVCSAPGAAYASPTITPFGTPPDTPTSTPPATRPTSLRGFNSRMPVIHETDTDTDIAPIYPNESNDSIRANISDTTPARHTTSNQPPLITKPSVPFWRRNAAFAPPPPSSPLFPTSWSSKANALHSNKALAIQVLVQDTAHDYAPASRHETIEPTAVLQTSRPASCENRCVLVRTLKRIMWRNQEKRLGADREGRAGNGL